MFMKNKWDLLRGILSMSIVVTILSIIAMYFFEFEIEECIYLGTGLICYVITFYFVVKIQLIMKKIKITIKIK